MGNGYDAWGRYVGAAGVLTLGEKAERLAEVTGRTWAVWCGSLCVMRNGRWVAIPNADAMSVGQIASAA